MFEKVHANGIFDEPCRELADGEAESLFKPDGTEDTGGIFHKAEIVQYSNRFCLDVLLGIKKIDEGAEPVGIELDYQGIDGKISTEKIQFDGTHFHRGQGGGKFVIFHPGRGHINFKPVRENDHGGSEFCVGMNTGVDHFRVFFGKGNAVAFDNDINVLIGSV